MASPTGVLLINIGTPDSPGVGDVRRYLKEFLSDPRILDIHPVGRFFLLNCIILPFRPKRSAEAYSKIWTAEGSPLLVETQKQAIDLQSKLGNDYVVELGMRYGSPSIETGIDNLQSAGCHRIIVLPLFPQYSAAATGSAAEKVMNLIQGKWNVPPIEIQGDFYNHPGFIESVAQSMREELGNYEPDLILFSYHGLPERHMQKSDAPEIQCDRHGPCPKVGQGNRFCYRAQCYETTRLIAEQLQLNENQYEVSFQSRLGRTPWIHPYTDILIEELAQKGIKRLAVVSPSFVADCLETLEEIGMRLKEQWRELGGENFQFLKCVNNHPLFIQAITQMIRHPEAHPSALPASTTEAIANLG